MINCKDCRHWKRRDDDRVGECNNAQVVGYTSSLIQIDYPDDYTFDMNFGCIYAEEDPDLVAARHILKLTSDIRGRLSRAGRAVPSVQRTGKLQCPECSKIVNWVMHNNGHIWGKCETEGCLQWQE